MAKIGNPEASMVPGIEIADLNDGDIISATRKLSGDGGNTVAFEYTLPDGQNLQSEPVLKEHVGKAIFGWLEFVKQSIVEMSQAKQDAALRDQRAKDWDTPGIQPVVGATDADLLQVVGGRIPGGRPERPDDQPTPTNAKAYIKAKLADAKNSVSMLRTAIRQRTAALRIAERDVLQWRAAAAALTFGRTKRKGKK